MLEVASIPQLGFAVEHAEPVEHASAPALAFRVGIEAGAGEAIRSIMLDTQIQIAARRRGYSDAEEGRLLELFGTPERWSTTLRTLLWTRTTVVVPPFSGRTQVEVHVPCSYDMEVTASKYFAALEHGRVPLEFLFSGSVFYGERSLQTARLPWTSEAEYGLPVAVWREAMDRHFPGSAWLRLERESFERLLAFKGERALGSWDAAIAALLDEAERG